MSEKAEQPAPASSPPPPGYGQYPPQGYPPQGYPPQGHPPQGYPPQAYYPPPQAYPAQAYSAPVTVTTTTTTRGYPGALGYASCTVQCPSCGAVVTTSTSREVGAAAFLWCFILFLFFWPLCWLPLVMPSCQDTVHRCPACFVTLGRHSSGGC